MALAPRALEPERPAVAQVPMAGPSVSRAPSRIVAFARTARGRAHEASGRPCEDAFYTRQGPVTVAAIADGAGSARLAKLGAETVTRAVGELLRRSLGEVVALGPEGARRRILEAVDAALADVASLHGATPRDLASTLLFVAWDRTRLLVGHLGDGVVGARRAGVPSVISRPQNGEFANETVFIPTRRGLGDLRLYLGGPSCFDAFVLMTDGAAASLYGFASPCDDAPSLSPVVGRWWTALDAVAPSVVEGAVARSLEGAMRRATRDDCCVALVRRARLGSSGSARAAELLGTPTRRSTRTRGRVARAWNALGAQADASAIARRTKLHPITVRRHLADLHALGWG
jgi:hypothetical protein